MPLSPLDKAALRRWARGHRDALAGAARARAIAALTERIDREVLARLPGGATVGLYAAIRGEAPTEAVAAAAGARGLVVAYPRVVAGARVLAFHRAAAADLAPGVLGIPEPPADAAPAALADLAAVLVPGLLFDRAGRRLGWGGGYYDATLPATGALRVGVAFERQVVDELPQAAHDQLVHLIATDIALHAGAPGSRPWTP